MNTLIVFPAMIMAKQIFNLIIDLSSDPNINNERLASVLFEASEAHHIGKYASSAYRIFK